MMPGAALAALCGALLMTAMPAVADVTISPAPDGSSASAPDASPAGGGAVASPAAAEADASPAAAGADPVTDPGGSAERLAAAAEAAAGPPVVTDPGGSAAQDGKIESSPAASTTSPDGWTLSITVKDETQLPVPPLTTALSSREYLVGGTFNATLDGDGEAPAGEFEVGYEIGCGIAFGSISLSAPAVRGPFTVELDAGEVKAISVAKKKFKGSAPWVSIDNTRIKIDKCSGQSFIRSYATLTKSTDAGDAVLSWYGVTTVH